MNISQFPGTSNIPPRTGRTSKSAPPPPAPPPTPLRHDPSLQQTYQACLRLSLHLAYRLDDLGRLSSILLGLLRQELSVQLADRDAGYAAPMVDDMQTETRTMWAEFLDQLYILTAWLKEEQDEEDTETHPSA